MSEAQFRDVMYVGRKPKTSDRVTGNPNRVWNGLGDIQKTTPLEAMQLAKHTDVWVDVTDWDEAKRIQVVNKVRGTIREEQRRHQKVVPLHLATEEELREQLAKLRKPTGSLEPSLKASKDVPVQRPNDRTDQHTGDEVQRPKNSKDVVAAAIGAINSMDPNKAELFDEEHHPTQEAIEQVLGYKISVSERKAALLALKPPIE